MESIEAFAASIAASASTTCAWAEVIPARAAACEASAAATPAFASRSFARSSSKNLLRDRVRFHQLFRTGQLLGGGIGHGLRLIGFEKAAPFLDRLDKARQG